ncbi:hypothetical protein [Candidatus Viadribacter manganicus]|uniref:Uncharacterized protein n=1 Tax=Candidatus Viadribacter manganicus TaxID=1759059 RepID=A0A1B1AHH1_9PROT|nr:hypothetical protein [Candidatus Viadribacter manganicus]ANP45998.1 hypothetical protein ATE48_08730 [Candidatus Viadribacter manganicus]
MNFKTQAGHWHFAAARFPDAVQIGFEATHVGADDLTWIHSYEAIVFNVIEAARTAGASAAILIHGNPTLPPNTVSLRTIVRDVIRADDLASRLCIEECIECDEACIVVFGPLPPHRRQAAH